MERSLKMLRENHWTVAKVEHFNIHVCIRQDLFNFVDILGINPYKGFLAVQVGGKGTAQGHIRKIKAEPRAAIWLLAGGTIQVHEWRMLGKAKQRKLWTCRIIHITEKTLKSSIKLAIKKSLKIA